MARPTEEEKKAKQAERNRKWNAEHPEYYKDYYEEHKDKMLQYYQNNLEECQDYHREWQKEWRKKHPELARAQRMCDSYRTVDKKYSRGKSTITAQWVVKNIFTKSCIYCGEDDWRELGCDRIDNDKPHTPENVVCSCRKCNGKRRKRDFNEFLNFMRQQTIQQNAQI